MADERLLTLQEVADRLRVKVRTVQRLVEKGQLPAIRISRKMTRFRAGDVEAFIKAHRVGGEGAQAGDA